MSIISERMTCDIEIATCAKFPLCNIYTCEHCLEKYKQLFIADNCTSTSKKKTSSKYLSSSQSTTCTPCTDVTLQKNTWFWVLVVANAVQFIALISIFYCSICVIILRRRRVQGETHVRSKENAEPQEATTMHRIRRSMMDMWYGAQRTAPNSSDRIMASRFVQNNARTNQNQPDRIKSSSYIEVVPTLPVPHLLRH